MLEKRKFERLDWTAVLLPATLVIAPLAVRVVREVLQIEWHKTASLTESQRILEIQGWLTFLVAVLTLAVLVFQARIYDKQRLLMERQTETLPRIERAYVFAEVTLAKPVEHLSRGFVQVDFNVRFANHGRTPAMIRSVCAGIEASESPPRIMPDREVEVPDSLVIAPGKFWDGNVHSITQGGTWCSPDLEPTEALYCSGFIRYRDIMGDDWETGFCWHYRPFIDDKRLAAPNNTALNFFT